MTAHTNHNRLIAIFSAMLWITGCLIHNDAAAQTTLDSILLTIERQNPMLKEYDSKVKAIDEYAKGAGGWMAPMVGAGTFMTPYPNQMLMEDRDKGSIMFSLEQDIPNPAKQNANKQYIASRASVERQNRAVQFNQLRSEAKSAYYKWVVSEKKLKTLRDGEEIIELMIRLARIRYPYNQGTLGNIYKAEGRLSELQNMIEMTRGDIEESAARLKGLMNIADDAKLMIDTTVQIGQELRSLQYDTATLHNQRSDVRQIDRSIEVMRLNQRVQRFQAKPDFRLRFDHMQPIGNMPSQFTAMAMISIPIAPWSSKMYKSEVKGMEYEIEAMQQGRNAILIEAKSMLAGMFSQLTRMQRQLTNYNTRIIPALNKNYETVMLAYEENREELPMVIDAWEAHNMANLEYLEKLQDYYNMIVAYEKELEK